MGNIQTSAGLNGTTIIVEKLFFNSPARRAAFRNTKEEAQKISEVIIRYAIQYPYVYLRTGSRTLG